MESGQVHKHQMQWKFKKQYHLGMKIQDIEVNQCETVETEKSADSVTHDTDLRESDSHESLFAKWPKQMMPKNLWVNVCEAQLEVIW